MTPRTAYEISKLDDVDRIALAEWVAAEKMTRDQVADVVKARKSGREQDTTAAARAEFKLEGGCKVVISGLPDDRPETILAKLREATKQAQRRARDAAAEQAA